MNQEQFLEIKSMFIDISGATSNAFEAISFHRFTGRDCRRSVRHEAARIRTIADTITRKLEEDREYTRTMAD